jgi:hypothetical protein
MKNVITLGAWVESKISEIEGWDSLDPKRWEISVEEVIICLFLSSILSSHKNHSLI